MSQPILTPCRSLLLLALLPSCSHWKLRELPCYESALAVEQTQDPPIVAPLEQLFEEGVAVLVPYATASYSTHGTITRLGAKGVTSKSKKHKPDVIAWTFRGSQYAGSTTMYHGYGIFGSYANYRNHFAVGLYRIAKSCIGASIDSDGFVLAPTPDSAGAGLRAGDRILAVNGKSTKVNAVGVMPAAEQFLTLEPGELVTLLVLRGNESLTIETPAAANGGALPEGAVADDDDDDAGEW